MSAKIFSFYNSSTGEFSRRTFMCTDVVVDEAGRFSSVALAANTPEGFVPILGEYDPLAQRFDLRSRTVVDFIPPAPGPEYEWHAERKRWTLTAEASAREMRKTQALARVREIEHDQQPRTLREAMLVDPAALERLKALDDEIASLRADLRGEVL